MFKHILLIGLAIISFTLENRVVSAASDLAPPAANKMSQVAYHAHDAVMLHVTNPRYAVTSAVASVRGATATMQRVIHRVAY